MGVTKRTTEVIPQSAPHADLFVRTRLVDTAGFDILGRDMGRDLEAVLDAAIGAGVIFPGGSDALNVFRQGLATAIRDVELHPRGQLLQEFLRRGPYGGPGDIPRAERGRYLADDECARAVNFIYSHMVNCFKGVIAELFATRPCVKLLDDLRQLDRISAQGQLFAGDSVAIRRAAGRGYLKGADFHCLLIPAEEAAATSVFVEGVVEVKSYRAPRQKMLTQLALHMRRATRGLRCDSADYDPERVFVGGAKQQTPILVTVVPESWRLSRRFAFDDCGDGRQLRMEADIPRGDDVIEHIGDDQWHVTLRWSEEALAAAAYEMTFWYMAKVGEVIYADGIPSEWAPMSLAEAGCNAAKMMLYYAIGRSRTKLEQQRAIALYNAYGFGFALGANFRNADGKREMLWPEDLDEILAHGVTKHGCRFR